MRGFDGIREIGFSAFRQVFFLRRFKLRSCLFECHRRTLDNCQCGMAVGTHTIQLSATCTDILTGLMRAIAFFEDALQAV